MKTPDLDRGLHLRIGCDRPEAPAAGSELLPGPTDFESHALRENAHFKGLRLTHFGSRSLPRTVDFIRVLTGQQCV